MVQLKQIRRSGQTGKLIQKRNSIIAVVKISVTGIFVVFKSRQKTAWKKQKVTGSGIRVNGIGQRKSQKVTIYYLYKNYLDAEYRRRNCCALIRILEFLFKGDIPNNKSFGPIFRTIINTTKVIENHPDGIDLRTVDETIPGVY